MLKITMKFDISTKLISQISAIICHHMKHNITLKEKIMKFNQALNYILQTIQGVSMIKLG